MCRLRWSTIRFWCFSTTFFFLIFFTSFHRYITFVYFPFIIIMLYVNCYMVCRLPETRYQPPPPLVSENLAGPPKTIWSSRSGVNWQPWPNYIFVGANRQVSYIVVVRRKSPKKLSLLRVRVAVFRVPYGKTRPYILLRLSAVRPSVTGLYLINRES